MCSNNSLQKVGLNPIPLHWSVVKGDSASLEFYFYELDEKTLFNTEGWSYSVNVYDKYNDSLEELDFESSQGYLKILASSDQTVNWGPQVMFNNAELTFDVKAIVPDTPEEITWTFATGTVLLINDVMNGGSL